MRHGLKPRTRAEVVEERNERATYYRRGEANEVIAKLKRQIADLKRRPQNPNPTASSGPHDQAEEAKP